MNSIKSLFLCLGAMLLCSPAYSQSEDEDLTLKLNGLFQFEAVAKTQTKLENGDKNVSGYRNTFAFDTRAHFSALASKSVDCMTYGAKLVLVPTTNIKTSSSYNGSHIFIESDCGKIEIGSPIDAGTKMMIGAYDIAAATGDGWTSYAKLDGISMKYEGFEPEFVSFYGEGMFTDTYKTPDGVRKGSEPPRLISYYTPKFLDGTTQIGISYIPDTSNNGGIGLSSTTRSVGGEINGNSLIDSRVLDATLTNVVTGGLTFEKNFSDGVDLKLSVTGQYSSKPSNSASTLMNGTSEVSKFTLSPVKAYNIGSVLTYGNMSYNLAYGSLGKSLTSPKYNKSGRNTNYYGGAIAYGQGGFKSSVSYFKSNKYKNTLDFVSLGTEYKIMPGLLPYAELSYFRAKGMPTYYAKEASKKKTSGTVFLLGTKLSF